MANASYTDDSLEYLQLSCLDIMLYFWYSRVQRLSVLEPLKSGSASMF